jgi:hypothetical protein
VIVFITLKLVKAIDWPWIWMLAHIWIPAVIALAIGVAEVVMAWMTEEGAVALYESGFWKLMFPEDIAKFQLAEKRLCMPFKVYHEAVEKALGRPVFTHDLGSGGHEGLMKEILQREEERRRRG